MGGKSFTVLYQIARNRYRITLKVFIDFGANNLIFINILYAIEAAKFFNITVVRLKNPCPVRGYNGEPGNAVTHIIIFYLVVNGRRQLNIPILILDLGQHDLIFRRKWFKFYNI